MESNKPTSITRGHLAEAVSDACQMTGGDALQFVDAMLDVISESLQHGDDVMISGFGKFVVASQRARTGRNPRNGEPVQIEARKVMRFRPAETLKEAVNRDVG